MPGYSCSIKERMLYSSCKAPLLDLIQSLGVIITKKVSTFNILIIHYNALFNSDPFYVNIFFYQYYFKFEDHIFQSNGHIFK